MVGWLCGTCSTSFPTIDADEPSGNLDAHNADRLHDLFAGLARSFETAVVVVTHNVLLSQRADRVLALEEGRLVPAHGLGVS